MRIFRVVNISIKTLATNLVVVSALSTAAVAQSFDYPANSPTIFNRGATQTQRSNTHQPALTGRLESYVPPAQTFKRAESDKPNVLSKLFSGVRKKEAPVFGKPLENPASASANSYSTGESVYLDSYADNLIKRYDKQVKGAGGYQPTGQHNQVQPANFNQVGDSNPHSILERAEAPRAAAAATSAADSASPPAPANVDLTESTRLTKKAEPIVGEPAARVAQRPAIPNDAFKQEFEKAYRYINQSTPENGNRATRLAKADSATRELTLDDFTAQPRNETLSEDFSPNSPPEIETPAFIRPEPSEQSPNALAPNFNPPQPQQDVDTFSAEPVPVITLSAPAKTSERALLEALKANDIEGDFEDSLGDIDQWEPPKPSSLTPVNTISKESLDAELAEIAKPLLSAEALDEQLDKLPKPSDALVSDALVSDALVSDALVSDVAEPDATESDATESDVAKSPTPKPLVSASSVLSIDQSPIWWKQQVTQPLHPENQALPINSNGLVFAALQNSPRIQAVSKNPLIRELQVVEADAEFDPVRFVRSQWQDRVDPVGSSLTINDNLTEQFLRDNIWTAEAGIRRKLRTGADVNVSQQLGFQNSNSNNFVPQDQGTATLALNVTQPLLRGRGRAYNQAQILIAQSTGGVAWEIFQKDLQEELEGVVGAYWQLYLERSIYLQRKRNVQRGQVILDRLNGRRELDSLPSQIARAKSSVQTRRTELANAFRNVRNAETEIRRRVADRNWMASQKLELLPEELPTIQHVGWELDQVVQTALNNRPEIREAMRRIKIAGVQRDVSENELLPELSFLVGTYVSALRGESDIPGAFIDQFGSVTPGYSFGLEYELPRLNRAARSRFQQRHLQFKRLQNELEEVIQNVIAESQIALRRITSAIETLAAAEEAIVAAKADLDQNETRWESFALVEGDIAEGVTPTTILDQLLDSQERLSQSEIVYAQAEQELKVAELALQRSMGTLLMHRQVSYDRQVVGDTPVVNIQGGGPTPIVEDAVYSKDVYPSNMQSQRQPFVSQ